MTSFRAHIVIFHYNRKLSSSSYKENNLACSGSLNAKRSSRMRFRERRVTNVTQIIRRLSEDTADIQGPIWYRGQSNGAGNSLQEHTNLNSTIRNSRGRRS